MTDADSLTDELHDAFDADEATARTAAENALAFAEEYDFDLVPADLVRDLEAAPYDAFERRFNWWVGDTAADIEDCTNSREYRFLGFDEIEPVQ
jgi:hypothetical protein